MCKLEKKVKALEEQLAALTEKVQVLSQVKWVSGGRIKTNYKDYYLDDADWKGIISPYSLEPVAEASDDRMLWAEQAADDVITAYNSTVDKQYVI